MSALGAGCALFVLGMALRWWGYHELCKVGITNLSGLRIPRVFTDRGPYQFTHHPLYLGSLFILSGVGMMALGWGGFIVAVAAVPYFAERAVLENELREGSSGIQ